MLVSAVEAEAIDSGVKKFLLLPASQTINVKEIRQINDGGFAAIVALDVGTLDHWLHDKALLQDHACAHPHELADYLRRKFANEFAANSEKVWMKIELVRVPDWTEMPVKEIKSGLFRLLFKMKTENRL